MQQSAAEKDRGRSGKIQIQYDFDVLLMTYDKFCVVRKSLQLRMEKNPVLFLQSVLHAVPCKRLWKDAAVVGIWSFEFILLYDLTSRLHWDGDKGREKDDKTRELVPVPNVPKTKFNGLEMKLLSHLLRFKL